MRTVLLIILIPLILSLAFVGIIVTNSDAQYSIGRELYSGRLVYRDAKASFYWWRLSARGGNTEAQIALGRCLLFGIGEQNQKEAVEYLEMAAKSGDWRAYAFLSYAYEYGLGVEQSYQKCIYYLDRMVSHSSKEPVPDRYIAAALDTRTLLSLLLAPPLQNFESALKDASLSASLGAPSPTAQEFLGTIYEKGLGTTRNIAAAVRWHRKAILLGSSESSYSLGRMILSERVQSQEGLPGGRELIAMSSNLGKLEAQLLHAILLAIDSERIADDEAYTLTLHRLEMLGFGNFSSALNQVSSVHDRGDIGSAESLFARLDKAASVDAGTSLLIRSIYASIQASDTSAKQAREFLDKAIANGSIEACCYKSLLLSGVEYGAPDYQQSIALARKASAKGNSYGAYLLANHLARGLGAKQDWSEAVELLQHSAEQGVAEAEFSLGCLLVDGRGLRADRNKAAKLIESAFEKGCSVSSLHLGAMYSDEDYADLEFNPRKAQSWYERGAKLGYQSANFFLGELLRTQNVLKSETFYKIAASHGHLLSMLALAEIERSRGSLKSAEELYMRCIEEGNRTAARELYGMKVGMCTLAFRKNATSVVIASRNCRRGEALTPKNMGIGAIKLVSRLPEKERSNAIIDSTILSGAILRRNVSKGQVIVSNDLEAVVSEVWLETIRGGRPSKVLVPSGSN